MPVPSWPMRAVDWPGAAIMLICELLTVSVPVPQGVGHGVPPTFRAAPADPGLVMLTTLPLVIVAAPKPSAMPIERAAPGSVPPVCWPDRLIGRVVERERSDAAVGAADVDDVAEIAPDRSPTASPCRCGRRREAGVARSALSALPGPVTVALPLPPATVSLLPPMLIVLAGDRRSAADVSVPPAAACAADRRRAGRADVDGAGAGHGHEAGAARAADLQRSARGRAGEGDRRAARHVERAGAARQASRCRPGRRWRCRPSC